MPCRQGRHVPANGDEVNRIVASAAAWNCRVPCDARREAQGVAHHGTEHDGGCLRSLTKAIDITAAAGRVMMHLVDSFDAFERAAPRTHLRRAVHAHAEGRIACHSASGPQAAS